MPMEIDHLMGRTLFLHQTVHNDLRNVNLTDKDTVTVTVTVRIKRPLDRLPEA